MNRGETPRGANGAATGRALALGPDEARELLDARQRRWLRRLGPLRRPLADALYVANWAAVRSALRLRVRGRHHLPARPPFLLVPNHSSSLDPFVLAAALPWRAVRQLRWAARADAILRNPWRRAVNRLAGSVPIDGGRSSLAVGLAVLEQGESLVWFAEGHRTRQGNLQPFKPGVGVLMQAMRVPVVPVHVQGTYQAMPPERRWPRLGSRVTVAFGRPVQLSELRDAGRTTAEQLAEALHDCVADLGSQTMAAVIRSRLADVLQAHLQLRKSVA